ncbi:MAG: hypothetical protein BMS9Abin29_2521 [Gemmatimonadota bacterium]|nr:MAG: hypothetical protein BMS9Abin29_2521 [Gemmatimonadota bacterium]
MGNGEVRAMTIHWGQTLGVGLGLLALSLGGCEKSDLTVPTEAQALAYFAETPGITVEVGGNVLTVKVDQPFQQLRRGGALWARVGPYVYLFTTTTEQLFNDFGGLAGVRVTTRTGSRHEFVATALLARNSLNDLTWRRARNIAGRARLDGTERPSLLEDLVQWGEDHTEFEYSTRWVPR